MLFNFEGLRILNEGALRTSGGVAQMGEHLPCKQGVRSSILLISTNRQGAILNGLIAQAVRAHA